MAYEYRCWCLFLIFLIFMCQSCTGLKPQPFETSQNHIQPSQIETTDNGTQDVPDLVEPIPPPSTSTIAPEELYSVSVHQISVEELLFELGRDSGLNIDIHPDISNLGLVTLNAVDQSLTQILQRIAKQVPIRYEFDEVGLFVAVDEPFLRIYKVDYLNMVRDTSTTNTIFTQIASASGGNLPTSNVSSGGNNSSTDVFSESAHHFWTRLVISVSNILGETDIVDSEGNTPRATANVIPNPETGLLLVRATQRQHQQIGKFINEVMASANRQVLIQTTIVEVTLSKNYQAGIDWSFLNQNGKSGVDFRSTTLASTSPEGTLSSFVIDLVDNNPAREESLTGTVRLLEEFGSIKILSSPQIMVLNNQTATLKVVENIVYFEIDSELAPATVSGGASVISVDTTARTVPVGIVMAVTPQIDQHGKIILNVRPTISRRIDSIADPNPNIPQGISNLVPQIAVREIESVLRMNSGEIGVLGGLMQDRSDDADAGLPWIKRQPLIGRLFRSDSAIYDKTELVVFIRPILIRNPDIEDDLQDYQHYLPKNHLPQ